MIRKEFGKLGDGMNDKVMFSSLNEATRKLAESMASKRDELIREAITSVMGDDWALDDVKHLGEMKVYPDKHEEFEFKGVPMLAFYGIVSDLNCDNNHYEAKLLYKKLY
jgi:hypothetical protein